MKKDIESNQDIKLLVDTFYSEVRKNNFLGPIFESYLADHWDEHHQILYKFWHTVTFKEMHYYGNPVPVHFSMHLTQEHFDAWLVIWTQTVDGLFEGKRAENAKLRGRTMAAAFLSKIEKKRKIAD